MKIEIQDAGIEGGTELHHFTRCCAGFELGTFRNCIESVSIFYDSLEAAIDGKTKSCRVEVRLHERERVRTRAADTDLSIAIFWALERAGWAVADRLENEPAVIAIQPAGQRQAPFSGESNQAA